MTSKIRLEQTTDIRFRKAVLVATMGGAIIALAGLLGYIPGLRLLGSFRPDYIPMAPTTSAGFLIFSAVLSLLARKPLQGFSWLAVTALVLLCNVFSLLAFIELFVKYDLNFDDMLIPASDKIGNIPVGQISPATGATFSIVGLGILLLLYRCRSPRNARQLGNWASSMGALTVLIGATVLLAYLYGTPFMYGSGTIPMAATTALAFLFLGVALVASTGPESFPICQFAGNSTSALLSRVFLPLVLVPVILQSILSRYITASHLVNEALIMAILVIAIGLITVSVVNRVASSTGSNIDETSRKLRLALEELQHSEEHHRTILQTAMDGVWLVDTDGGLLEVNNAYCQMSGYSARELLAMRVTDLEANDTTADTATHFQKVMAQGEYRFESKHRRKDGSFFEVEVSVQHRPVRGRPLAVFLHDITERKMAEQQLIKSRKQYCDLVEGTTDLITRVDTEGRLLFVNHAALEIFGLATEDCLGRRAFDFIHPEDREATVAAFHSWLKNGEGIFTHENRQVAIDGREHHMAWSIRSETDENGTIIGLASTARDVTYRKKAEEEKSKLESQLLQAMKMESVGSLAGGVAHDFNNKLTVIIGHTCLALTEMDIDKVHGSLEEIRKAAEQSAELTRQLLAFARKQTIAPKVLNLNETVASMLKMLQRIIGEDIRLTWQPAPDLWLIKFDPSQIDQILTNLCVNARDSIGCDGKITIETGNSSLDEVYCSGHADAVPGEYVRLVVSDNGSGMVKKTLDRIFEPFFTTKETGKGTGLGLSTVFGIVKQNNGFINVYSEPGLGTTFTIYLPRHSGKSMPVQKESMIMPAPRGQETIMVVEDELAILDMTTQILTNQGYTVLQANTPAEAIRLAKEHVGEIRLLITDVVMPEMNGKDLASTLLSLYPQLKCLFMSGYTADAIAHHGVLDEGVYFIQKPFSLSALATKVRKVLEHKEQCV